MAKINREETIRRMMATAPTDEELENIEAPGPNALSDHDFIMCFGTLLEMAGRGHDIDLDAYLDEARSRASRYVRELLRAENLLVMEDE